MKPPKKLNKTSIFKIYFGKLVIFTRKIEKLVIFTRKKLVIFTRKIGKLVIFTRKKLVIFTRKIGKLVIFTKKKLVIFTRKKLFIPTKNIFISISYTLYDRLIEPKRNVKSLSIKNYATINIEKEYKYDKINNFGTFLLDILKKLNTINQYEYKIEQSKIDLNILNQNNIKSLKDTQKLMLKYPEFINETLNRYIYLLKRTNFENKDPNVEPILEIDGDKNGIAFIIDSYHLKTPLCLYYSLINKYRKNKILGLTIEQKDLNYIKQIENNYKIVNIHLSYLLTLNDQVSNSIIKRLINIKATQINLFFDDYIIAKKKLDNKSLHGLIKRASKIYVHNEEIKTI